MNLRSTVCQKLDDYIFNFFFFEYHLGFDKWIGQNIELKNDYGVELIKPNVLSVRPLVLFGNITN